MPRFLHGKRRKQPGGEAFAVSRAMHSYSERDGAQRHAEEGERKELISQRSSVTDKEVKRQRLAARWRSINQPRCCSEARESRATQRGDVCLT